MNEMVQVPSVKQYFNTYIVEPLKDKKNIQELDLLKVKAQVLDAFKKELFGQIVFKLGPEAATMSRDELAKIDAIHNILVQTFRKWKRLCILCSEQGLGNYFQLEDLQRVLEEEEPDPEEVVELPPENQNATVVDIPPDVGMDVTGELVNGEKPVILNGGTKTEVDGYSYVDSDNMSMEVTAYATSDNQAEGV